MLSCHFFFCQHIEKCYDVNITHTSCYVVTSLYSHVGKPSHGEVFLKILKTPTTDGILERVSSYIFLRIDGIPLSHWQFLS
jgi:hypothetical protein